MLNGKKTYLGILTVIVGLVLGWVGIGDEALIEQVSASISDLVTVGGALFAAYGRAKAQPKA